MPELGPFCVLHGAFADHDASTCTLPTREVVHTIRLRLPLDVTAEQIGNAASAASVQWDEADNDQYAGDGAADPAAFRTHIVEDTVTVDGRPLADLHDEAQPDTVRVLVALDVPREYAGDTADLIASVAARVNGEAGYLADGTPVLPSRTVVTTVEDDARLTPADLAGAYTVGIEGAS